jgi:hypothetical protein
VCIGWIRFYVCRSSSHWMTPVGGGSTLQIARSSKPPWCSAVRRLMMNKWFSTFAFAVPPLLGCAQRWCASNERPHRPVGEIRRRGLVSWYSLPTTSLLVRGHSPVRLHSNAHVPCGRDHRCSFRSAMTDARPHLSVGLADLRRHNSALPVLSCHGHADDSTCQSRWILVATPRP